jgi:hypothetical protein
MQRLVRIVTQSRLSQLGYQDVLLLYIGSNLASFASVPPVSNDKPRNAPRVYLFILSPPQLT